MDLSMLYSAVLDSLSPEILFLVTVGTVFGIIVGSLPGLTSTMGVALLVPVTFGMSPMAALALLGAIYASSSYAGSISAILLNIPGTPSNCCTVLDGFPMTKKGEAARALALSTIGSSVGGLISVAVLLGLAPLLARFALEFGPQEYFVMALFGVAIIATLSKKNLCKGLIAGVFGLLLSIVGMHPLTGEGRFTFDIVELYDGISLVTALIGLYSIPEVVTMLRHGSVSVKQEAVLGKGIISSMREILHHKLLTLRASLIGIIIGIVPGAGQSIASFIAYDDARRASKTPDEFGKGSPEGVLASEVANNAVVGGSLIPALTLGIPGNAVSAVMISGLMIHGLQPGPALFTDNPEIAYGFIFSLFIANIVFIPVGIFCARYCVKLIDTPAAVLAPIILGLAVVGSFAINGSITDVWIMLLLGAIGCVMKYFDVPREPLVLGLVLGTMAESELARGLALAQGSVPDFIFGILQSPICLFMLALTAWSVLNGFKKNKPEEKAPAEAPA